MLDSYWHGATSRISPEAPVPVVLIKQEEARVGGAGNVAINAAVLGAKVSLLGLTGDDAEANQIEQLMQQANVDCHLHRIKGSKTITKLRIMSRHQQLLRLDKEDGFPAADLTPLHDAFAKKLQDADVVVLSDYAKGALHQSVALIAAARKAGKTIIVDPKGVDFERYRGATLLTPNLSEFEAVVGHCANEADIVARGLALCERFDFSALLVTRSEKGMSLIVRDQGVTHLPARAQEVFDVTGAGDTVVASLAASLAAGLSMPEAALLSNIAAGIVVAKLGTSTVSTDELQTALGHKLNNHQGECSESQLKAYIAKARAAGERIVMTNGCFDLLHPGHIDYLEKAATLGDRLIVALNDDASIQRLKGPTRPINSLAVRARMMAALACVDWVISFSEDTPERLISSVLPDILVKGGDYTVEQVAGGNAVKAAGGEVRILHFLDGYSTSKLIEKIQNQKESS